MSLTPPAISLYWLVQAHRREGETILETAERLLVTEAMYEWHGNQKQAGEWLGLHPVKMYRRCVRHKLDRRSRT